MARRRLITYLYPSYMLIAVVTVVTLGWYAAKSLEGFHLKQTSEDLEARAILISEQINRLDEIDPHSLNQLVRELGSATNTRITIIATDGLVLGDSEEKPEIMDNHADRPEVIQALSGQMGSSIRFSHTLGQDMMYVAIPLRMHGKLEGVVRTSLPLTRLYQVVTQFRGRIVLVGLLIIVLTGVVSYAVSRRLSRPLEEMKRGAEKFAAGDFQGRLSVPSTEELGSLAESLNKMARQMDRRMRTITQQRNEREAMLSSMVEGVLAVDTSERIMRVNQAAARLFDLDPDNAPGRPIQEVIRHVGLQQLIQQVLSGSDTIEAELTVHSGRKTTLQTTGTILQDASGLHIGALIVMNDISRLKHLESMRREFVANVSHELKTPITAIKGFAEILLSDELHEPEKMDKFLNIIACQTDRLNAIIDDLLVLARIEQHEAETQLELEHTRLFPILESAAHSYRPAAAAKGMEIILQGQDKLQANVNVTLLEQAVANLIDNAVKYGNQGGKVDVTVEQENGITIRVADDGPGIAAAHLPHIFTRFYRIDKGRSRSQGGTGLGLAIVKHIALAHGGSVDVESAPGVGSTFSICLPIS